MNYGTYIYTTIRNVFGIFRLVSNIFDVFENLFSGGMYFGVIGVRCIINGYFEYVYRIMCIFLYI